VARGRSAFVNGWESSRVRLAAVALTASAVGAALQFLFDARSGRRRRALIRDRAAGAMRRRRRQLGRNAHREAGKVVGLAHSISGRSRSAPELDDVSLVRKVETELFRDRSIPKGKISINSDRGIVVLRGALEDERQIRRIEHAARRIAGVREVENLLHAPGAPAPPSHPHGPRRSPRSAG
jgi:hypothetical protein